MLFCIFWTFTVEFIIWPGAFYDQNWSFMKGASFAWVQIVLNIYLNVLDATGRQLAGRIMAPKWLIMAFSLGRTIFIITSFLIAYEYKVHGHSTGFW